MIERSFSSIDMDEEDLENMDDSNQTEHLRSIELVERYRRSLPMKGLINLECRVCGAPAHGYNFDQISCESCKAFFRRNALRPMSGLKCRYSGSCEITMESRRQCTFCRLKKCFDVKMRKEWIRTEEEKTLRELKKTFKKEKNFEKHSQIRLVERKKNRILSISNLSSSPLTQITSLNHSLSKLTLDEHALINNIHHCYDRSLSICPKTNFNNYSFSPTSLINFLNDEKGMCENLIGFFKQIPEFRRIALVDQIVLIKCNLTHLIHLHHILRDSFVQPEEYAPLFSRWISPSFHQRMVQTRSHFNEFSSHPILLKLTLLMMIFTMNLSRLTSIDLNNEFENRWILFENENFYLNLLWKYFNVLYDEKEVYRLFSLLIFQHLRYQTLMNEMDLFVYQTFHPEHFHPLTKSLLRLT